MTVQESYEHINHNLYSLPGTKLNILSNAISEDAISHTLRSDARENLAYVLDMTLCNLVRICISKSDCLIVQLDANVVDKKSRYKTSTLVSSKRLRNVIELLANQGLARVTPGSNDYEIVALEDGQTRRIRRATRLYPTPQSYDLCSVTLDEIGVRASVEAIILKDRNKKLIDYDDGDMTNVMREHLAVINQHLRTQPISYTGDNAVDFTQSSLRRIFSNGTFSEGGRFYGHWGQNLDKSDRCNLRLDQEPTAEVDWSAAMLRLLHASNGYVISEEDPYEIDGFVRSHVKDAVNMMLNMSKPSKKGPKEWYDAYKTEAGFQSWPKVTNAIIQRYPLVGHQA